MIKAVRKIVVVDDNRDLLYTIRVYLADHGHAVWTEAEGRSGIRRIAAEQPHVAFCALNLPALDGYHLARTVRRDPELCKVRLIAMTADSDPTCFRRAQLVGFETTLVKPVPLDEMLRLVEMPAPRMMSIAIPSA